MKLDIIIPTYSRAESLRETLQSFLEADVPKNLDVLITVVDNNSDDRTKQVVEEETPKFTEYSAKITIAAGCSESEFRDF